MFLTFFSQAGFSGKSNERKSHKKSPENQERKVKNKGKIYYYNSHIYQLLIIHK